MTVKPDLVSNLALGDELARAPGAFPGVPGSVERFDTHISMLFFVGDRVFKVKKALRTPFLDFSTLELRRHFCEEEVRLNRRLAPDIYRGVVPIRRSARGIYVGATTDADAAESPIVDYAVEMERLPRSQMWDQRLDRGEVDNAEIHAIVALLVGFHQNAPTGSGVQEFGSPDAVTDVVVGNVQELAQFIPSGILSAPMQHFLHEQAATFLKENRTLFEARVTEGRIRDGHGDLHTANICVRDAGAGYDIVVYDCIEFAPQFRCADVAADLAFLAMDLDCRGFRGFSRYFVKRYVEATGDRGLLALMDFYKTHRALVRAKVEGMQAATCSEAAAKLLRIERARSYVHLAVTYAFPRIVVLMCGLPGSGKSWAAKAVARTLEAVRLVSDQMRDQVAEPGGQHAEAASGHLDTGRYAPEQVEAVYCELKRRARKALGEHRSVVVDASFGRADRRHSFGELAQELGVPVVVLWRTCPEGEARSRLERRAHDPAELSEADLAVRQHLTRTFEAPVSMPSMPVVEVGHVEASSDLVAALLEKLCQHASAGWTAASRSR